VEEKYAMKKVKIAFWIIVFGFVGLVIFQNKEFFMAKSGLMINLGFFYYETPFLANAIFFVAFFLIGILISYFLSLFKHFSDAKIIKTLKAKEASLVDTVSALQKQLSEAKVSTDPLPAAPVEVAAEVK
jgi:predicted membrane protein